MTTPERTPDPAPTVEAVPGTTTPTTTAGRMATAGAGSEAEPRPDTGSAATTGPDVASRRGDAASGTAPDAGLERWRLLLGSAAEHHTGPLSPGGVGRDAALDWLYGRDPDLARRGVRRSGTTSRTGGNGPSALTTVDWLDDIHRLFPKETVERLERDAVERYGIQEIVTDPAVLERVEPSPTLLRAVLRTKHLMNPEVLRLARRIVESVVRQLLARLRPEVRRAFHGTRSRTPSRVPLARDFDFRRTVRANLAHYQPAERRLLIERAHFHSRTRRHMTQWQLILLVDQSGSMAGSVIHSAVTAACLWGLPGLKTHLVAFDTQVVDLTADVSDPVELLMRVQLGGGTDIARAVRYAAGLVENPRRTILALVTDFYEGGDAYQLVRSVRSLVEQGTTVLGLAALDEDAEPDYDRGTAARLAEAGAHVGAMTPGHLAEFVAERLGR
ncbi:VWA domain-containing protein [Streptomyces sp. NPDC006971]|uniref:VWA domain-containing protein n=1 Tax=Streptomyces sp. NPDC006971 TaxID=3154784 RepID=UPI003404DE95